MSVIAHNTDLMGSWIENLDSKDKYYLDAMNELFNSVQTLVGSPEFSGGIPENFQERVLNKRSSFDKYSQTFEDLCKFMKQKKDQIEDDTSRLVSEINNSGVL